MSTWMGFQCGGKTQTKGVYIHTVGVYVGRVTWGKLE